MWSASRGRLALRNAVDFLIVFLRRLSPSYAAAMQRKSIISALLLAAICLAVLPQRASAVAGVYYITMTNGYTFVANQLNFTDITGTTNNNITNVVVAPPEGTRAYQWDFTNQVFATPAIYHTNGGWGTNNLFDCPPGKGFVLWTTNTQWSNTFVGQVPSGSLTNTILGQTRFSLMACIIPVGGRITADLGFPGTDGDDVYLFRTVPQQFTDAFTFLTNYGWFDPNAIQGPGGPVVGVGESFFIQHPGTNVDWVIQFAPSEKSLASSGPAIRQISVRNGQTILRVDPAGGSYNVQFSSDGRTWQTVATNQTAAVWSGPYPGGVRAYYKVVRP